MMPNVFIIMARAIDVRADAHKVTFQTDAGDPFTCRVTSFMLVSLAGQPWRTCWRVCIRASHRGLEVLWLQRGDQPMTTPDAEERLNHLIQQWDGLMTELARGVEG